MQRLTVFIYKIWCWTSDADDVEICGSMEFVLVFVCSLLVAEDYNDDRTIDEMVWSGCVMCVRVITETGMCFTFRSHKYQRWQISNQILHAKSKIFKHKTSNLDIKSQSQIFKNIQITNILTPKSQILHQFMSNSSFTCSSKLTTQSVWLRYR